MARQPQCNAGGKHPGYDGNPLSGSDFDILQLNVVAPTANPVTSIPSVLMANTPIFRRPMPGLSVT